MKEIVMGAGADGPDPALEDAADEVGRQRRKHWAQVLNSPVAGFPDVTLGQVVAEADGAAAPDVVQRFLAGRGHTPETISTVQGYLELQRALEARLGAGPDGPVDQAAHTRRAWVLEELQSRLLKD